MRTSLLFAALMFTACTDDTSESDTPSIPGPVVSGQVCREGCSADLQTQIADLDFDQVSLPSDDGIIYVERSPLGDICSHLPSTGDCVNLCQPAKLPADGCRVLSCDLTDGRLLVGRTCR